MTWWQRLLGLNAPQPAAPTSVPTRQVVVPSPRAIAGGRVSMDNDTDGWFGRDRIVEPPGDYEDEWRLGNFDANTLSRVSPARLIEILSDLSPEISRALWDFQRLFNPGWELKALRPGGKTEYPRAQKVLDAFIGTLNQRHGTVDVLFGRFSMSAFWRGALFGELVLDESGRMPLDIVAPDPINVRFRKVKDAVLGTVYEIGQWQNGEWVSLDLPTVAYVPVDPALNSPYGRPMVSPALFTALFLLTMLHDLKRVVQQQGYPRLDISIDLEKMAANFDDVSSDPRKYQEWADALVQMVIDAYSRLEPDDAYVHTSTVTVNRPVGAVDASSLGAVDALIKANERMATRALKTMPLMMGLDQSTNETDSNRQWEIFAAGIKSVQHYAETLLKRFFQLALECQGIQADITFNFAELRAAEELRDEQTRTMRINNAKAEFEAGWIDNDEAAQRAGIEHPAVLPGPRNSQGGQADPVQGDGDGQERNDLRSPTYITELAARLEGMLHDEKARSNGHG